MAVEVTTVSMLRQVLERLIRIERKIDQQKPPPKRKTTR